MTQAERDRPGGPEEGEAEIENTEAGGRGTGDHGEARAAVCSGN